MTSKKKLHIYFGFKNQKLVTIIYSLSAEAKEAVACDYYITNNIDAEKQIAEWKKRLK